MAIDFSRMVYAHAFDTFARPVTFTPTKSQPGQPAYSARGIFNTQPLDVLTENGVIFSDQQTVLDILENEYSVLPMQGDRVNIPAHMTFISLGDYEIIERVTNGGGETTLTLRKILVSKP